MSEGLAPGASKIAETVYLGFDRGIIYQHEARKTLRKLGYELDEGEVNMPDFTQEFDYPELPIEQPTIEGDLNDE